MISLLVWTKGQEKAHVVSPPAWVDAQGVHFQAPTGVMDTGLHSWHRGKLQRDQGLMTLGWWATHNCGALCLSGGWCCCGLWVACGGGSVPLWEQLLLPHHWVWLALLSMRSAMPFEAAASAGYLPDRWCCSSGSDPTAQAL